MTYASVSYTHLDVYKRQEYFHTSNILFTFFFNAADTTKFSTSFMYCTFCHKFLTYTLIIKIKIKFKNKYKGTFNKISRCTIYKQFVIKMRFRLIKCMRKIKRESYPSELFGATVCMRLKVTCTCTLNLERVC